MRLCANCRHFEVLEEGYDIARVEDLKYMLSACRRLGWRVKENYLFRAPEEIADGRGGECPFWKEWLESDEVNFRTFHLHPPVRMTNRK